MSLSVIRYADSSALDTELLLGEIFLVIEQSSAAEFAIISFVAIPMMAAFASVVANVSDSAVSF